MRIHTNHPEGQVVREKSLEDKLESLVVRNSCRLNMFFKKKYFSKVNPEQIFLGKVYMCLLNVKCIWHIPELLNRPSLYTMPKKKTGYFLGKS